jgi:hypothetical protein
MKRQILGVAFFTSVLLMCACSYRNDFVVINRSKAFIEVQYRLKRYSPETAGKFVDINPPAKFTLEEFHKSHHEWRDLSKEQYDFNKLTGTFTVSLAPDEVLLVDYAYNYRGDEDEFDLSSIKIVGANGSVNLEGKQAQTRFKNESGTAYVLQYN